MLSREENLEMYQYPQQSLYKPQGIVQEQVFLESEDNT